MTTNFNISIFKIVICAAAMLISSAAIIAQNNHWVSAYYAGWMQSDAGECDDGHLPSSSIDFEALTHIIHFAVEPAADGTILRVNNMTDCNMDSLVKNTHDAGKKAILCIGGANTDDQFEAAIDNHLSFFINQLLTLITARGYDGVDIDWEPLEEEDEERYQNFITVLRDSMDARDPSLLLTAANGVQAGIFGVGDNFVFFPPAPDVFAGIHQHLDQINLMTYDLAGPWPGWVSWHNAPLYDGGFVFPSTGEPVPSAAAMVELFIEAGIPRSKIGIGIDFYGYDWVEGVRDSANLPVNDGFHQPRIEWYRANSWGTFGRDTYEGNQWVPVDSITRTINGVTMSIIPGRFLYVHGVCYEYWTYVEAVEGDSIYAWFCGPLTSFSFDVDFRPTVTDNVPYFDIMDDLYEPQYLRWDEEAKATYLEIDNASYANDHFVSYDDQQTIRTKADYIFNDDSIGGVILWELGGGYRSGLTNGLKDSLLQEVKNSFLTTNALVAQDWNMASVPRVVSDFSVDAVYPSRNSSVYAYDGGYVSQVTLANGPGYWVKFPSSQIIKYVGEARDSFHIQVNPGWNIIGSIWDDLHSSKISTIGTTVESPYYGYNEGYYEANTIEAGRGYWVKVDTSGTLIIDRNAIPSDDPSPCTQPPPSPGGEPVAPTLASPSDGVAGVSVTPTLSWNASSGANSYRLQISLNSSFNPTVYDHTGIASTSRKVGPLIYSTTYHWRVNATNQNGTSLWSCPRTFTTVGIAEGNLSSFTIDNGTFGQQTVYAQIGIGGIEMPPAPPAGIFDARFQSGNFVQGLPEESFTHIPIVIRDVINPATFSWDVNSQDNTQATGLYRLAR